MTDFTMNKDAEGIATITWDVPGKSMNVMSFDGLRDLEKHIDDALADDAVKDGHGVARIAIPVAHDRAPAKCAEVGAIGELDVCTTRVVTVSQQELSRRGNVDADGRGLVHVAIPVARERNSIGRPVAEAAGICRTASTQLLIGNSLPNDTASRRNPHSELRCSSFNN